jgi:hypothetical protein
VARLLRDAIPPAAALAALLACALLLPLRPHGDAGEYLLMLESWRAHGSPELQPRDSAALRARLLDAGLAIDEGRYLPNYHAGSDGRLYCYHFWGYSLAGLPARRVLEALALPPLRALPVTNALAFGLALFAVAALPWSGGRRLLLGGLLVFSPALGFLLWPHPEVFSFALVATALAFEARGRRAWAVACAALASVQNPPLLLLAALLGAGSLVEALRRRDARPLLLAAVAALPAAAPPLFFLRQFGVWNLSVRPSEAAASLSASRALDLALDPNLGLLPHAPLTLALAFGAGAGALARRRWLPAALVLALVPLVAWATTANSNWNNDTSGPSRYTVWLLPLLAFVAVGETGGPGERRLPPLAAWGLGLALATQSAAVLARGGPCARADFLEHAPLARWLLDDAPSLYDPTPEVFVERTRHAEGALDGPVIYRARDGRCRKAYVQPRQADRLARACGGLPPADEARLRAEAARRETKRDWTYVSY